MAVVRPCFHRNTPGPCPDQDGTLQNPQSGKTLRADRQAHSAGQDALQHQRNQTASYRHSLNQRRRNRIIQKTSKPGGFSNPPPQNPQSGKTFQAGHQDRLTEQDALQHQKIPLVSYPHPSNQNRKNGITAEASIPGGFSIPPLFNISLYSYILRRLINTYKSSFNVHSET